MASIGEEQVALSATVDMNAAPFFRAAANVGRAIGGLIASLKGVQLAAAAAIIGVTAGLFVATRRALASAALLDAALREVATLTTQTAENMDFLRISLLKLSTQVPAPPELLTKGLYQVVSAGITDTAKALEVLSVSSRAAVAGVTDTFTAVDAITTVLNAYQLDATQASRVSDILFTTVREGKVTFEQLSSAIGNVATSAGISEVRTEELGAAVATLTKFGLNANKATTALNSLLVSILNPTQQVTEAANRLGIQWDAAALRANGLTGVMKELARVSGGQAEVVAELVPAIRSFRAAAVLAGKGLSEYLRILKSTEDSAGATQVAFEKVNTSLENQLGLLRNQINKFWAELGDKILPGVAAAIKDVNDALIDPRERLAQLFEAAGNLQKAFDIRKGLALDILEDSFKKTTEAVQEAEKEVRFLFNTLKQGQRIVVLEEPGGGYRDVLKDVGGDLEDFFNLPVIGRIQRLFDNPQLRSDILLVGETLDETSEKYKENAAAVQVARARLEELHDYLRGPFQQAAADWESSVELDDDDQRSFNRYFESLIQLEIQLGNLVSAYGEIADVANLTFEDLEGAGESSNRPINYVLRALEQQVNLAQSLVDRYDAIGSATSRNALEAQKELIARKALLAAYILQNDESLTATDRANLIAEVWRETGREIFEINRTLAQMNTGVIQLPKQFQKMLDILRKVGAESLKLEALEDGLTVDPARVEAFVRVQTQARDVIAEQKKELEGTGLSLEAYISQLEASTDALDNNKAAMLRWLLGLADIETKTANTEQEVRDLINSVGQGARSFLQFAQAIGAVGDEASRILGSLTELGVNLAEIIALGDEAGPLAIAGAISSGLNLASAFLSLGDKSPLEKERLRLMKENTEQIAKLTRATEQLAALRDLQSGDFPEAIRAAGILSSLGGEELIRRRARGGSFVTPFPRSLEQDLAALGISLEALERVAESLGLELPISDMRGFVETVTEMGKAVRDLDLAILRSTFAGAEGFADLRNAVYDIEGLGADFGAFFDGILAGVPGFADLEGTKKQVELWSGLFPELAKNFPDIDKLTADIEDPEVAAAWEAFSRYLVDNFDSLFKSGFFGTMTADQAQDFIRSLDEFTDRAAEDAEDDGEGVQAISSINRITSEQADVLIALSSTQVFWLGQIAGYVERIADSVDGGLETPTFEELQRLQDAHRGVTIEEINIDVDVSGVNEPEDIAIRVGEDLVREVDRRLGKEILKSTTGFGFSPRRDI